MNSKKLMKTRLVKQTVKLYVIMKKIDGIEKPPYNIDLYH